MVGSYWKNAFLDRLQDQLERESASSKRINSIFATLIKEDEAKWKYPEIEDLGATYIDRLLGDHESVLGKIEEDLFGTLQLSKGVREGLRRIVMLMYSQEWLHPDERSGIVIAGVGESEPFPILMHYNVGTIASGRLRFLKIGETRVGQAQEESDAAVVPFAQSGMIDLFYEGIADEVKGRLADIVTKGSSDRGKKQQD